MDVQLHQADPSGLLCVDALFVPTQSKEVSTSLLDKAIIASPKNTLLTGAMIDSNLPKDCGFT